MTRYYLTNLPVRVGREKRPRWDVDAVYVDWDRGVLELMKLHGGWSRPGLEFGPAVELREREVWIPDPELVRPLSRERVRKARAADWEGRPVVDPRGRLIGRVRDVEFEDETGTVQAVWVSRGALADVWHGMWQAHFSDLRSEGDRIALR